MYFLLLSFYFIILIRLFPTFFLTQFTWNFNHIPFSGFFFMDFLSHLSLISVTSSYFCHIFIHLDVASYGNFLLGHDKNHFFRPNLL